MTSKKKRPSTLVVEGGRRKEWRGRLVNVPVERASTLLFDDVESLDSSRAGLGTYHYGLQGTATHWALSDALTEFDEGAAGTSLYSSGLAAITSALLSVLSAGDELLVTDSVYGPTRTFCDKILKRFGVTTRYYDPLNLDALEGVIGTATRAILLESPGSLTMEVQDVPSICAIARERGIATILDNTWATPLFFPAVAAGVDISVIAATKYIGGHADVMVGAATANKEHFGHLQRTSWDLGHALSADDAWLASRGLRTLAVRLKQHEASAIKVAHWLKQQPKVGLVLHPALADCPGHEFWKRDFKGSTGLFSFEIDGDASAFVDRLQLFGIGFSWGGYESLALPARPHRTISKAPANNLVRLHIGLEDPDDLIEDLSSALSMV